MPYKPPDPVPPTPELAAFLKAADALKGRAVASTTGPASAKYVEAVAAAKWTDAAGLIPDVVKELDAPPPELQPFATAPSVKSEPKGDPNKPQSQTYNFGADRGV